MYTHMQPWEAESMSQLRGKRAHGSAFCDHPTQLTLQTCSEHLCLPDPLFPAPGLPQLISDSQALIHVFALSGMLFQFLITSC